MCTIGCSHVLHLVPLSIKWWRTILCTTSHDNKFQNKHFLVALAWRPFVDIAWFQKNVASKGENIYYQNSTRMTEHFFVPWEVLKLDISNVWRHEKISSAQFIRNDLGLLRKIVCKRFEFSGWYSIRMRSHGNQELKQTRQIYSMAT